MITLRSLEDIYWDKWKTTSSVRTALFSVIQAFAPHEREAEIRRAIRYLSVQEQHIAALKRQRKFFYEWLHRTPDTDSATARYIGMVENDLCYQQRLERLGDEFDKEREFLPLRHELP